MCRTSEIQTLDGSDCHSGPARAVWQLPALSCARHRVHPALVPPLGAQVLLASLRAQRAPSSQSRGIQSQPAGRTAQGNAPSHQIQLSLSPAHSPLSAFCKHHSFTSATIKGHFTNICGSPRGQDSSCRHVRTPHEPVICVSSSEGARASRPTAMPGLSPAFTGPSVAVTHPELASGSPVASPLPTAHLGLVSAPL